MTLQQRSRERIAFMEVAGAMALAGSSVAPAHLLGSRLPVFQAALLTYLFALAVMVPLQLMRLGELRSLQRRELTLMVLQSLFGMVLFRVFTLYGLRLTTALDAGIILSTTPAVTMLLGRLLLREPLGRTKIAALALTLCGVLIINLRPAGPAAGPLLARLGGNLLILCAVAGESLLTIFRKKSTARISAVTNTTVICGASTLLTLPLAAAEAIGGPPIHLTAPVLLAAAYYGGFVTVLGYLLWGDGALYLRATAVGAATGAMPIASTIAATAVLGEHFGAAQLAGCLLVLCGIIAGAVRGARPDAPRSVGKAAQPALRAAAEPARAGLVKRGGKLLRHGVQWSDCCEENITLHKRLPWTFGTNAPWLPAAPPASVLRRRCGLPARAARLVSATSTRALSNEPDRP